MAGFSQQEQNAMRQEAARRAREMQRRVHPAMMPQSRQRQHPPEPPKQDIPPPNQTKSKGFGGIPLPENLMRLLPSTLFSQPLDGDTLLILALMAMLYKDGGDCNKKLWMALAYLLT